MADVNLTCGSCGIRFCMPEHRHRELRRTHETFWCPNGCRRHFVGKSLKQERIERLEGQIRVLRNDLDTERNRRRECPFAGCHFLTYGGNRTLAAHLATKHGASKRPRAALPAEAGPDAYGKAV